MLDPNLPALRNIQTPALVVDASAMARNIAAMAAFARTHGVGLRPHAKTHKSPRIAQMQREAGAQGVCCATVAEIEAFAQAGISGLLLTAPVADRPKLERLAGVARAADISIVVDHADQIDVLSELLGENSRPLQVLVDIDVGQRRTGVVDAAATLALAQSIEATPGMRFGGIQGYAGHVQHIIDAGARKAAAVAVHAMLDEHLAVLAKAGIDVAIVTGVGTGACAFDAAGPYTEWQVGSYVFMDADYGAVQGEGGGALPYEPSLFVLATVTSVNRDGEFTVDAGTKALAFNGPMPELMIGAPEGSTYRFGGDEHGMITVPADAIVPKLGSRVLLLTTHCDPTVNLHADYQVVGHNNGIETWPVAGRYGS
jgi:D-serine deaminase-like pyridoxal phosphate-dependent protein